MLELSKVVVLSGMMTAGCGGKVIFDESGGAGGALSTTSTSSTHAVTVVTGGSTGSGGLDCANLSFDFSKAAYACVTPNECDLVGSLPDGRSVREVCTSGKTTSCSLFVEGVEVCTCPPENIDFASSCSNGVATCFLWKINYATLGGCPAK